MERVKRGTGGWKLESLVFGKGWKSVIIHERLE